MVRQLGLRDIDVVDRFAHDDCEMRNPLNELLLLSLAGAAGRSYKAMRTKSSQEFAA